MLLGISLAISSEIFTQIGYFF